MVEAISLRYMCTKVYLWLLLLLQYFETVHSLVDRALGFHIICFRARGSKLVYNLDTLFFSIRIYFIRISRLKFAKFEEYFKNKAKTEILKSIDIILCVKTSVIRYNFMFLT